MKKILFIIVLLISNFSYYGVVNEEGENVTNIQEIMQTENVVINEIIEEDKQTQEKIIEVEKIEEPKEPTVDIQIETIANKEEQKVKEHTPTITEEKIEKQVTPQVEQQNEKADEKPIQNETTANISINQENMDNNPKCTDNNHAVGAGNSNQWFDTEEQAIALYNSEIKLWGDKWTNYEIDDDTYYQNCPDGYEDWTCPLCGKWTINLYY